jgi:hypothetical protein
MGRRVAILALVLLTGGCAGSKRYFPNLTDVAAPLESGAGVAEAGGPDLPSSSADRALHDGLPLDGQPPSHDRSLPGLDSPPSCGSSCSGCCASTSCQGGSSNTGCGTGGAACQDCTASGKVCSSGACVCADPITTDAAGCVKATCSGWPSPQVDLTWCGQSGQTVNAVQRSICCPGDSWFSWVAVWGDSTLLLRSWTDTTVTAGTSYTYRVKYQPAVASNTINVPVTACNCK